MAVETGYIVPTVYCAATLSFQLLKVQNLLSLSAVQNHFQATPPYVFNKKAFQR